MRSRQLFLLSLAVFLLGYLGYGLQRMTLGIDFTDEGAYLSWPLRMLFGERPFTSELVTLTRPIEVYLFIPFKLHPSMTLYEFRLLGWLGHLLAFAVLSVYLFHLSKAPLQSPLIASVPFFACHVFGLAEPGYNTLSCDFLLMALCLWGLATAAGNESRLRLGLAGGLALFIATLAHPGLGLVAAFLLLHEWLKHDLGRNVLRRRLTASNLGALVFLACWVAFALYLVGSGALAAWYQRIALARTFSANSLQTDPVQFFLQLAQHPFAYTSMAMEFSVAALMVAITVAVFARLKQGRYAGYATAPLALLLAVIPIATYYYEPAYLPDSFALASLIVIGTQLIVCRASAVMADRQLLFLILLSGLAALLYATLTYSFGPHRSWISGILGLPFAFAVGLTLLLNVPAARSRWLRFPVTVALMIAVFCLAEVHYREIYRDGTPEELQVPFQQIPKLRHIRSTAERVQIVEELYAYLHPKLARGEPLLAFDNCPMLYYLFDALPGYGLAWATRYSLSPATLQQLNRELNAKPLPRYAIRTLVAMPSTVWRTSPPTDYASYPLNETLLANYQLERTIFPFEIWRLNPASH